MQWAAMYVEMFIKDVRGKGSIQNYPSSIYGRKINALRIEEPLNHSCEPRGPQRACITVISLIFEGEIMHWLRGKNDDRTRF